MKSLFTKIKKIATLSLLTFSISLSTLFAQAPEKMSYQAVIRNSSDQLVVNSSIGMQISILQGSASGTAVYIETQIQSTNENGVVTLEIGGGNVVSGTFTNIDWANGIYFIKTETDIAGGTNYTITATSQLLSVPYALYAKIAGTATTTSGHYVGELFGGGIVFWVSPDGQHGLIASLNDLDGGSGVAWSNVIDQEIGATAQDYWDGLSNSNAIVSQTNHISSAAIICLDYSNEGFDDWYLPAIQELIYLISQNVVINFILNNDNDINTNGFPVVKTSPTYGCYWSSKEDGINNVYYYNALLHENGAGQKNKTCRVRAIRKF